MINITLQLDPLLPIVSAVALRLWWLRKPPSPITHIESAAPLPQVVIPAPVVHVAIAPSPAGEVRVLVPSDVNKIAQDQHRVKILQRQPDRSWQEIGHADFTSRDNPGERILSELAAEGRAIMWPDGTIQESGS